MTDEFKNDCCCEEKEELKQILTEDGRRGEKRVKDTCDERITEIYLEPQIPMNLTTRVREEKCPMVCKRITERYDSDGKVIEQIVEGLPEEKQIRVVDHIVSSATPPKVYATRDDLDELRQAIESTKKPTMVSAQGLLADKLQNTDKEALLTKGLVAIFVVEVLVLGWVVFFA